ncbi:MAG: hypothetical protein O7F17_01265 [Planctomycetota bacterium]|nr:hypothetical protein [Planctomycetota bacterium]
MNFGKYWWAIILAIVAWQVLGSLAERLNKKPQEQRLKDLAEQRRRQAAGRRTESGPDDLVARRRAQIEELRARHVGSRAEPQMHVSTDPSTATSAPPAARMPFPVPSRPAIPRPSQRSAPQQLQARTGPAVLPSPARGPVGIAPVPRHPAPQPTAQRPQRPQATMPAPAAPPLAMSGAELQTLLQLARSAQEQRPQPPASPQHLGHPLFGADDTPRAQTLRRMIVLKELLDLPVSLRDRDVWDKL